MSSATDNQCLLETPYFKVVRENGYFIIKEAQAVNGVVAVPTLADGRLMLVELKRRAIGGQSIEFPRGAMMPGKAPMTPRSGSCWKKPAGRLRQCASWACCTAIPR